MPPVLRRLTYLALETVRRFNRDDGNALAAATAFYAAFSFFPLLMVLTSALGFALRVSTGAQNAQHELVRVIGENASPWLANQVAEMLDEVQLHAPLSGPLGLATLLLGSIGIFAQCERAFDRIWSASQPKASGVLAAVRSALVTRLKAFLMLLFVGALVIAVFVLGIVLSAMRAVADELTAPHGAWHATQIAIGLATSVLFFGLIYKLLPRAKVRWRDAWRGALVAALVWQIGQLLLVWLVIGTRYTAYGIIGSFIAMMIWAYFSSAVLFLGAELVHALGESAPSRA